MTRGAASETRLRSRRVRSRRGSRPADSAHVAWVGIFDSPREKRHSRSPRPPRALQRRKVRPVSPVLEVWTPRANNVAAADLIPFSSFCSCSHPRRPCSTEVVLSVHRAHPPERPDHSVESVEPLVQRAPSRPSLSAPLTSAPILITQLARGTTPPF